MYDLILVTYIKFSFYVDLAVNLIDCNTKAALRESDFEAEKILVDSRTMYRCKVCWWISPHILDYKKHRNKNCFVNVKTVGDVVNYECRVCAKLFCEVPTNSKTIYVCNICKKNSLSKGFTNRTDLKNHHCSCAALKDSIQIDEMADFELTIPKLELHVQKPTVEPPEEDSDFQLKEENDSESDGMPGRNYLPLPVNCIPVVQPAAGCVEVTDEVPESEEREVLDLGGIEGSGTICRD